MYPRSRMRLLLTIAVFALTLDANATQLSVPLDGHGALELDAPDGWDAAVQRPDATVPPTVQITAPEEAFVVLITPLWSPAGDASFNSPASLRKYLDQMLEEVRPSAIETEFPFQKLDTKTISGLYFVATDKAPKKGEFEYLAQGVGAAGNLVVSFTILAHEKPPGGIAKALEIVRTLEHVK